MAVCINNFLVFFSVNRIKLEVFFNNEQLNLIPNLT